MALNMRGGALTMCRMFYTRLGPRIHPKLGASFDVNIKSSICSSCCRLDGRLSADSELSWVRRILQGSGPSAEVEEEEEEVVEVEPRYMQILQETQSSFISRPETRRRNYSPPSDVEERLAELTVEIVDEADPASWREYSLEDNALKYKVLSKCAATFHHCVPSYQLRKMRTMGDVLEFYETPVKDTTVFDELSTKDLPPNLRIQWDYNDSKLEVYQEYLDYVKERGSPKPTDWPYRPSY